MDLNVRKLRENLIENILGLGISSKFLNNPAFYSILSDIDGLFAQMDMPDDLQESIEVDSDSNYYSFSWVSPYGEKYLTRIRRLDFEKFSCVRVVEKKPIYDDFGRPIRRKEAVEHVVSIDEDGWVNLAINSSMVDNYDCSLGECNSVSGATRISYTPKGVMNAREYRGYPTSKISEEFSFMDVSSMLYVSREAFNLGVMGTYSRRELLVRDKLDTARYIVEDKGQVVYSSIVPLNKEYGLKDMVLGSEIREYPGQVFIPQLQQDDIEYMIKSEPNPVVAEGLRDFAVNRSVYMYYSGDDTSFVCADSSQHTKGSLK